MWARIRAWFTDNHEEMLMRVRLGTAGWAKHVVEVADECHGMREEGANNRGPDLDVLRRGRKLKPWQSGAWCASFCSYILEEGWARRQGYRHWDTTPNSVKRACPVKRTPSASGFARRVAKAGCIVEKPEPGDFVLFKYPRNHHIGVVIGVGPETYTTKEGNKGGFNKRTKKGSRVRNFTHEYDEPSFRMFVRLP